jgi:hypothetical protein
MIWKRIEDICPRPSLFVDGVEPDDILQGTLGDCWFLGPLSVIALYPNLLMNLFNTSDYTRWGVYAVSSGIVNHVYNSSRTLFAGTQYSSGWATSGCR